MTETAAVAVEGEAAREAPLLEVRDLRTYFKTDDGIVKAVDGVSFSVRPAAPSASWGSPAPGRA